MESYPGFQTDDPLLIAILGEYAPQAQRGSLEGSAGTEINRLKQAAEEAPIILLVDCILRSAIKERATEIHIEPLDGKFSLRFLIDGTFQEIVPPARQFLTPIVSRIKILARLKLAEQHQPQEGEFLMKMEGREIRFKVLTTPVPGGEDRKSVV